jgi:hypothetical protein
MATAKKMMVKTRSCKHFYRFLVRYHENDKTELGDITRTLINCRRLDCFKQNGYIAILHHIRRKHTYSQEGITMLFQAYGKFMDLQRFLAKNLPAVGVLLLLALPGWCQAPLPSVAPQAVVTVQKKVSPFKLKHPYLYKLTAPVRVPCGILYKVGKKLKTGIEEVIY